jgi:hypothetical protein
MTKDYLTSPFNDEIVSSTFSTTQSIQKHTSAILSVVDSIPKVDLSHIYTIPDNTIKILNDTISTTYSKDLFDSIHTISKTIQSFTQPDYLRQIHEITKSYSDLIKVVSTPYQNLELSNLLRDFESFIEDETIYTDEKIETNNLPSNSESEVDIVTKAEKIQALQNAFFEFILSCKLLKESLNHSVSYSFDRLLSNYGFSSALSSLIALIKPNDPLFPITIFLIMGIIQEIFRKK